MVGANWNDDAGPDSSSGSAYIFERNSDGAGGISANKWGEVDKLTASDAAAGDIFGSSVSISGDTIVVGAFLDDGPMDSGSAYIFNVAPPHLLVGQLRMTVPLFMRAPGM